MKRAMLVRVSAAFLVIAGSVTTAFCERTQGFEHFSGGWSGDGTARLEGGGVERVRCSGAYAPVDPNQLRLSLTCASDSLKVQLTSEISRQGDSIKGTWSEANFGVSGSLNGSFRGDRIDAAISGPGVTARLSLAVHGSTQAVSLVTQSSQFSGTTTVMLHRR